MDELANEGSTVSDYHFPRLGIIGGFNYPSLRSPPIVQVAREALSGSSQLRRCALVCINYAGGSNYIFMYSDNYIFNTADARLTSGT